MQVPCRSSWKHTSCASMSTAGGVWNCPQFWSVVQLASSSTATLCMFLQALGDNESLNHFVAGCSLVAVVFHRVASRRAGGRFCICLVPSCRHSLHAHCLLQYGFCIGCNCGGIFLCRTRASGGATLWTPKNLFDAHQFPVPAAAVDLPGCTRARSTAFTSNCGPREVVGFLHFWAQAGEHLASSFEHRKVPEPSVASIQRWLDDHPP